MQNVSRAYKTEQKGYLRNESYVWVYLGIINREAQLNAQIEGDFSEVSGEDLIFENQEFEAYYGSCEQNQTKVDGSMYFRPRDDAALALYQGAVTRDLLGSVRFRFGSYLHLDIKGLTIDFGEYYPTRFKVTNGYYEHTYTHNSPVDKFETYDEYLDTSYIDIIPLEMVGGQQRLRIFSISFGVGLTFGNKQLLSTSWKRTISHISGENPSETFAFSIDNLSKNFAADDPHSFANFLQEKQDISFSYGRKLDDGTIYPIDGSQLILKSWSSDDVKASFTAVGKLEYVDTTFYKGQYYPDGISLYDLALLVIEDAGIENYIIDSYLKNIITHNPLPKEKHRNLLQLIANMAMSVFYEDRKGNVVIKTSFVPEITNVECNGEVDYSNVSSIVKELEAYGEYGSCERDFTRVNRKQYFKPRHNRFISTGFISSYIADEDGLFETNPTITIEYEAMWTFFNMSIKFSDAIPESLTLHTYGDGVLIESIEFNELSADTVLNHDFVDVDKVVIEFTKTQPHQRIHVGKVLSGAVTDYSIDYRDMSTSPTAVMTDLVKSIDVHYYEYAYGDTEKTASTVSVEVGETTTTFNTAYHDYSLKYKEITDDDTEHTKVSKVFTDELPSVDDAKSSTLYFVPTQSGYDEYQVETNDNVKSWQFIASVVEVSVDELPSTLADNTIYVVPTETENIYHLYILGVDSEDNPEIKSLGYDVRGTLEIIESGAYYITFTSDTEASVQINATEFVISDSICTTTLKEKGVEKTAKNALIDSAYMAQRQAQWLKEYFSNDIEYKISYRGEVALDPDDQIFTENKHVEENLVRITDMSIDTSTGQSLTCTLNARRTAYKEYARINYAIINESMIGEEYEL